MNVSIEDLSRAARGVDSAEARVFDWLCLLVGCGASCWATPGVFNPTGATECGHDTSRR